MSAVPASRRKLSIPRLIVAILVTLGIAAGGVAAARWVAASAEETARPWFAGYADVTATPTFAFETPITAEEKNVMLSFIVADPKAGCTPSWGAAYSLTRAAASLDLDRRVARLQQQGGEIAISFGGQANDELAVSCTDVTKLAEAYTSVIDRYDISTIDLDVEGAGLGDAAANARRAEAVARVQKARAASGSPLAVWLTLPIDPSGLTLEGQAAVRDTLSHGVDLSGVNAMTMDYGTSRPAGTSMIAATEKALTSLHRQLDVLYREQKLSLSDKTLWGKIGVTPMIGQNDVRSEVFSLADARQLNSFVLSNAIGRVSMWSLNRDKSCSTNYVDKKVVSDSCSGITQKKGTFASLLGSKLTGSPHFAAGKTTSDEPVAPTELKDNPATSPYQIWSEHASYLQGTKVVWHRSVYEAKWWTRGDTPDDPVLNTWQTPWELVGPVLKGETPIPQPTLPVGTYPDWSGETIFDKGARVLFDGVPYEAKWWTQGDSPEAASSDPDGSPWIPLTQAQIEALTASTTG
ncbi:MAG TPA: chitinase [Pseudolysinimonas sp.]|nr:chitinase [Pseudolysinimonas sp.]